MKKRQPVSKAAEEYNLSPATVRSRLRYGWTAEQAVGIESPPRRDRNNGKKITIDGVTYSSITKASEAYGVHRKVVMDRCNNGWSIEQAFGLAHPPLNGGEKNGRPITVAGGTYSSLTKAAIAHNLSPSLVHKRIYKLKWTNEQAFGLEPSSKKPSNSAKKININGVSYNSITDACSTHHIGISSVQRRVKNGMSLIEAITKPSSKKPIVEKSQ